MRRPALPGAVIEKAEALRTQELSCRKIGKELGLGKGTIRKRINGKTAS